MIAMVSVLRFVFLFLPCVLMSLSCFTSALPQNGESRKSLRFILGDENLGKWSNGVSETAAPALGPSGFGYTFVLAGNKTIRPDILKGFKKYHGGWDITNRHYWASVGFTGAFGFIIAVLWFILFGIVLVAHYCCKWRIRFKGEESTCSQRICLILLILFTCGAAVGCILLTIGENQFYGGAIHTLKYVVNQSDSTVQMLKNVTEYLSLAKTITIAQLFLPTNVLDGIEKLDVQLNIAADTLKEQTRENSRKIVKVFKAVRLILIIVAAVMFVLALLGFVLSILGHKHAVHIFVVSGWLLVAITFLLCGIFMILDNAISDTCLAMREWVDHPRAETALSNILPCVDKSTTNMTLYQSKEVVNGIVTVVNQFIYTIADANAKEGGNNYYNQSGPSMPALCYPFNSHLEEQKCGDQDVSIVNASLVWQKFVCTVTPFGLCSTVGRVTPEIYGQLVAAVNESHALQYYTPLLLNLQDCKFVQDTFKEITTSYCPPLGHDLKILNAGLGLISVGVLLCLLLWILYADRPQMEEVSAQQGLPIQARDTTNANEHQSSPIQGSDTMTASEQQGSPIQASDTMTASEQQGSPIQGSDTMTASEHQGSPIQASDRMTASEQQGSPVQDSDTMTASEQQGSPIQASEQKGSPIQASSDMMNADEQEGSPIQVHNTTSASDHQGSPIPPVSSADTSDRRGLRMKARKAASDSDDSGTHYYRSASDTDLV